jgi:hypothetical protein
MQAWKQGCFIFGSIVLVLVHQQLIETQHAVFSVAHGPYKTSPERGAAPPLALTTRTCISWAPGVDFDAVEAWWQDLMHRPVIRQSVATEAESVAGLKVTGLTVPDESPRGFATGVKLLQVRF